MSSSLLSLSPVLSLVRRSISAAVVCISISYMSKYACARGSNPSSVPSRELLRESITIQTNSRTPCHQAMPLASRPSRKPYPSSRLPYLECKSYPSCSLFLLAQVPSFSSRSGVIHMPGGLPGRKCVSSTYHLPGMWN